MLAIIKETSKNAAGKTLSKPVRGIVSLPGESRTSFKARAERECKEGESVSDVFSRFSSIPAGLLAGAWKSSQQAGQSTEEACNTFGFNAAYTPAWASAVRAINPKADSVPEDLTGNTQEEEYDV